VVNYCEQHIDRKRLGNEVVHAGGQATIAALEETILKMGENAAVVAKDAMAAKEQVAALQERVRTATQLIIAEIGASGPEDLEEAIGRIVARLTQHTSELEAAKAELEQERVRLASCLIAAEGGTKDIVKHGDYGWSPAYQATLNLQAKLERVRAERDHAKKMEVVQKEVADNQTWHEQKLRTLLLALPKVEGEITASRVCTIMMHGLYCEEFTKLLQHRQGMEG